MIKIFYKIAWKFYFTLPSYYRQLLKNLLKSGGGHENSLFNKQIAIRDAQGKCSLETATSIFVNYLEISRINSIEGKKCLEIGVGYVAINSVIMWLLGAKSVYATDLNKILTLEALNIACHKFDKTMVYKNLRKYVSNVESLKQKINTLYDYQFKNFEDVDFFFKYKAPFNLLKNETIEKFDFIFSISVLEHIPPKILNDFMISLMDMHEINGESLHFIDLTDHYDHDENPFGFLSKAHNDYNEDILADSRGNRVRSYEWIELIKNLPMKITSHHTEKLDKKFLPTNLLEKYKNTKNNNLLDKSILIRFMRY